MEAGVIALIVLAIFLFIVAAAGVQIVPQAQGRRRRAARPLRAHARPGLTLIVPFIDRVKPLIDLREQVVTFPPQPVITEDNLVVGIDTVIYFTVTDPKAATYEVANPLQAIEQLTVTTLRNVIGGLTLEETLTSRDNINSQLRVVLDEATGKWGIRVNRVELKSVEPPRTVQEAMEKQMRAERDRRAAILTAEGVKESQILTAEGEKQSAVLKAEGARTSAILRAEGESKAIETVFQAIHDGAPDQRAAVLPVPADAAQLAQGAANKIFVIPSEFNQALGNLGGALSSLGAGSTARSRSGAQRGRRRRGRRRRRRRPLRRPTRPRGRARGLRGDDRVAPAPGHAPGESGRRAARPRGPAAADAAAVAASAVAHELLAVAAAGDADGEHGPDASRVELNSSTRLQRDVLADHQHAAEVPERHAGLLVPADYPRPVLGVPFVVLLPVRSPGRGPAAA